MTTHDIQIGDWVTYWPAELSEPRRSQVVAIDEEHILLIDGSRHRRHDESKWQVERDE